MGKERKIVSTPSLFAVDNSFEDNRFVRVRIDVLESDVEARGHGIRFSSECLENAKDKFANVPILANVIVTKDKEGNEVLDFGSHDFHVEEDKFSEGEGKLIYDEAVVGIVPESNDVEIRYTDEGHAILSLTGYIFKDYSNYVADILKERDGETSVSAELDCSDMKFIEEDNITEVETIEPFGITLLGADVDPAIPNAHATMFSSKEEDRQTQLMRIMQELKESLDNYTKTVLSVQNEGKEETRDMGHFEELLAQYNLKAEDITFEYADMSDEELDAAFAELAKKDEEEPEAEAEEEETDENTVDLSVKLGEKTINLSKSLTEVIYALTELVNNTYAEDGTYYAVDVFDSGSAKSKYVVMQDVYSGRAYRQTWTLKDGAYSLKNEREEVFSEWMTAAEREQFDKMRSSYAALSDEVEECKSKLSKYEAEPDKKAILESDDYAQIVETKEYSELLEDHFDISTEELSAKLDSILLSYVKEHSKENLAAKKPEVNAGVKLFPNLGSGKVGRYGGLFSK